MSALASATSQDGALLKVQRAHETNDGVEGRMAPFAPELPFVPVIVMHEPRDVMPKALRDMLQQVHEGYLGLNKCKARARLLMYWSGTNADIETMVGKCETQPPISI